MVHVRTEVTEGIGRIVYPNGLALTLRADARVPVAAARCYVRGGSVSEAAPGGRGIAHLLEHLVATAAAAEMEHHGDGALLNAFTSQDYTCFHWSALAEDVLSSVRRFFAGLRRVATLAVDVEAEKKVVLEEIELFREKRLAHFQQCFLEQLFEVHPLRYPVCGYPDLLRDVGPDDVAEYVSRLYTGANLHLVIAGDVDEGSVIDAVDEACGELGRGRRFVLDVEEPPRRGARSFSVETRGLRGEYTQVGLRIGAGFDDAVAFAALAQTVRRDLADGGGIRELAARSVSSAFGAGYFYVLAEHDPGAPAEDAVRRWLDDVAAGRAALPLDAIRGAATHDDEPTLDGWTALLGHGDVRSAQPLENRLFDERLATISEDEIRGAVARSLDTGNVTVGRLTVERRASARRSAPPQLAPVPAVLPNAVRTLILPTPSAIASCQVLWRGGVLSESDETNGLSSLMARLLPVSIAPELRPELRAYQAATGAELFAFTDENFCGVSLTGHERDLQAGLRFLAALAVTPVFETAAVEQERERTAQWISAPVTAWLPDLQARLKRLLYRHHPYRMPEIGRPESLRRLTRDDVAECHRRMCTGANTAVVVSGRVAPDVLRDALAPLFARIPEGTFTPADVADEGEAPGTIVVTRPPGLGALAIGYRGLPWEPRRWAALELLKALLVGPENNSVRGRLMRAMREEGAAYGVHCYSQGGFTDGYFSIMAAYAPEKEDRAVAIVTRELDRLREGGITAAELDHGRKLYLLQHLRQYESPRTHAYAAGRHLLFSPDPASWSRIAGELRELTVDDLTAAARLTFREDRRGVVLVRPEKG